MSQSPNSTDKLTFLKSTESVTSNETPKTDHGFDGISDKFARNIYGTTKGTLRHTLLCYHLQQLGILPELCSEHSSAKTLRVLDAGCGLG